MAKDIILHVVKDWSKLNTDDSIWAELDLSNPESNFGIHKYNGNLWTSGYVGVGRLYKSGKTIQTCGKEHVILVESSYGIDPWKMLERVLNDDEFVNYELELKKGGKELYKIFYDEPIIKLAQATNGTGELLYALSFLNACYELCKKGLIKSLVRKEDNYTSKIRGKLDIKKNIRANISKGRNDRFYCKYIDFTIDNIQNRIIKATLIRCKKLLENHFSRECEVMRRYFFCKNALKGVKEIAIKNSHFNNISITGLYSYYNPVLKQAYSIWKQKYYSYKGEDGNLERKCVYTVPYMINMEAVFEFYVRIIMKQAFAETVYDVESYSKQWFIENNVTKIEECTKNIHLSPYSIPDIVIRDRQSNKIKAVIDAKYKNHERTSREDSLQLLAYVLLTGAEYCGFVFPGEFTAIKGMNNTDYIEINTPLLNSLKYRELVLGNDVSYDVIVKVIE